MKKPVVTLLHIGYWLVYLLLLLLVLICIQLGSNISKHPLFVNWRFNVFLVAFTVVPAIIGFYSCYFISFTQYLAKKKTSAFFLSLLLFSLAGTVAGAICLSVLQYTQIGIGIFSEGLASAAPALIIMFIVTFLNGVVGLVMKGFITWYADIKIKEELTEKNHATEMALVKSQLDPHFLFNTINNIDVLIEKDAPTASLYLNKLSHIMRFMLYETKTARISLQKELEYIEKYIELQKIRSSNKSYVCYKKNIAHQQFTIPPMLFIPFIENAFKHAPNKKEGVVVNIHFETMDNGIVFFCENSVNPNKSLMNNHSGLGLELIQKRLQLLYPSKHELNISYSNHIYKVHLIIIST